MGREISYVVFQSAWRDWQEFYDTNNPCPYANSGECPEPCPVSYEVRRKDVTQLWSKWWKGLPDDHWLKDHELLERVEWSVVEGGKA